MKDLLYRLTSRKFWSPIIVSAIITYNAWVVLGRGLEWTEIIAISTAFGLFIGAEGIADAIQRGKDTSNKV